MLLKSFFSITFGLLAIAASAVSQQGPAKSSDFNIEILDIDNHSHIFSIPEPPHRASYTAHVNLKRMSAWKPPEEALGQVAALRVQFWLDDGTPQIEVTAYLGKPIPNARPYDWEKMPTAKVVSRALTLEDTVTINEVERFGIAPFQIRAMRAQPWSVGLPQITNKTQSVIISGLSEARPNYLLKLRNLSHKAIDAIRWYGKENDHRTSGSSLSGTPIVGPGVTFELRQRFGFNEEQQKTDSGEWVRKREIVIAAIVFEDGTYEGEVDEAAEMAANMAGDSIQLRRINRLVRGLSAGALRDPEQLRRFKIEIAKLSIEADQAVVNKLVRRFASATEDTRNRRIKEEVANGLRSTKNNLLREIEKLEFRREGSNDVDFELWLKDLMDGFKRIRTN